MRSRGREEGLGFGWGIIVAYLRYYGGGTTFFLGCGDAAAQPITSGIKSVG